MTKFVPAVVALIVGAIAKVEKPKPGILDRPSSPPGAWR